ncbi:MAG: serine/threonine protein kinase [Burkholderiales bacterium]|nr:serine/threonine protein kinase [Burkholderiales bacterium]
MTTPSDPPDSSSSPTDSLVPPARADWAQVRQLFDAALAVPAAHRATHVAASGAPPDVQAEVLSLLAHATADGDIGVAPALLADGATPTVAAAGFVLPADTGAELPPTSALLAPASRHAASPDRQGERLGPWQIVGAIGHGGMGDVYEVRRADGSFEGRAAAKLLRRGLDSTAVLARFAQEQQALARLNHPHIARLFDAGRSAEGLPFFVMELVDGHPIDQACKPLALEARLGLFLQLADAVAHAHRHLLVHRDLKPSNVLVTHDGQVKLLDFGIAKALDPAEADASTTQAGVRPYTPHYASPEQIRGEPVGTATDLYSLGVLLYLLLTGVRPYGRDATTPQQAARSALEDEPSRPSSLPPDLVGDATWLATRKQLQGDLDNILLKALAKPVEQRYASVDALAADVRAHLGGFPVGARAPSWRYRTGKFVRRQWPLVLASSLGLLALVGGLAAALWQNHQIDSARRLAEQRLAGVKKLTRDVVFRYGDAVTYLPGGLQVKEGMMVDAAQRLEAFAGLAADDPELRADVATAWARLAYIQGDENTATLGKPEDAIVNADRALALAGDAITQRVGDAEFVLWMARAHGARGHALRQLDRKDEALVAFQASLALLQQGLAAQPRSRQLLIERATMRHGTAQLHYQPGNNHLGRPDEALVLLQQARTELEALEAQRHDVEVIYQLGTVVGGIELVHLGRDEMDLAIARAQETVALRRRSAEEDPSSTVYADGLMTEANNLGFALLRMRRGAEAVLATTLARETALLLARQNGPASKWARFSNLYAFNHGRALAAVGRHAEAIDMYGRAEGEWHKMQAEAPAQGNEVRLAAIALKRGLSLLALGRRDEARAQLAPVVSRYQAWAAEPALRHTALVNAGEAMLALAALESGDAARDWQRQAREALLAADQLKPLIGEPAELLRVASVRL